MATMASRRTPISPVSARSRRKKPPYQGWSGAPSLARNPGTPSPPVTLKDVCAWLNEIGVEIGCSASVV